MYSTNVCLQGNSTNPKHSKETLLVGFSFTLRPDGSPGRCNRAIGEKMWADIEAAPDAKKPLVAMQWEIYDALEEMGYSVADFVSNHLVVKPPFFTPDDILSRGRLIEFLTTPYTQAQRVLKQEVERIPEWRGIQNAIQRSEQFSIEKEDLATLLNGLLDEDKRTLYQLFKPFLDLHDLHRSDKGPVGLEKRKIPSSGPNGQDSLRRFQTVRVNRLIVEEIIPERVVCKAGLLKTDSGILKRGEYLNVDGVASTILGRIKDSPRSIKRILVYGHPEHRDWCRSRTAKFAAEFLGLSDQDVNLGDNTSWDEEDMWDAKSAQVWCRSCENWRYYTAL